MIRKKVMEILSPGLSLLDLGRHVTGPCHPVYSSQSCLTHSPSESATTDDFCLARVIVSQQGLWPTGHQQCAGFWLAGQEERSVPSLPSKVVMESYLSFSGPSLQRRRTFKDWVAKNDQCAYLCTAVSQCPQFQWLVVNHNPKIKNGKS